MTARAKRSLLAALAVIAVIVLVLATLRAPGRLVPRTPDATSVSGGGITLTSATIALPVDDGHFPAGAHADMVDAACTACHSAAMALTQPPLSTDQWQKEVTKMREVYRAPIAEGDVAAIVTYLAAMPGQAAPAPRRGTM